MIWRSGSAAVVYRGKDYVPPSLRQMQERVEAERMKLMSIDLDEDDEEEVKEGETSDRRDNDLGESASPDLGWLFQPGCLYECSSNSILTRDHALDYWWITLNQSIGIGKSV